MEDIVKGMVGRKIDVCCGPSATFRGDVLEVRSNVLVLRDEHDVVSYIAIDKIASVTEVSEHSSRPGFIG